MINQSEQMTYRLGVLDSQQQRINYQMSTREKLQNGSDDAFLYSRDLRVDDKIRMYEGIYSQLEKVTAQNSVSDTSVKSLKEGIESIKAELIKANTATTNSEGLKAIKSVVEGTRDSILSFVNTKTEGEYIFAGSDATVKPFTKDASGKIVYNGDDGIRKSVVEDGVYKERGINGYDLMYYPSSTAYKGDNLEFKETDVIFDQDGNQWKLNSPTNNTLEKYDKDGNATGDTITGITNNGATPPVFSATMPNTDGLKFEAKTSIFDELNTIINSLDQVDDLGNPISLEQAREKIGESVNNMTNIFDSVNSANAKLGARNRYFIDSQTQISAKKTQFEVLSEEITGVNYAKLSLEVKALELTYTALYSTINKTNELSLVNFVK